MKLQGEFKVVKKNSENSEAKVSNLPVNLIDAPMVIDLPDGQKIILNKLQEGAVIEVATWHGTGRPDSRTNRFMLGMSAGQSGARTEKAESVSNSNEREMKIASSKIGRVRFLLQSAKSILLTLGEPLKAALQKSKELTPVDSTTELEINAWLESLKSQSPTLPDKELSTRKRKPVKGSAPKKKR